MTDDADLPDSEDEEETVAGGRGSSFAAGLALGALLGAAVALLVAPAPGHVTRRRLRHRLDDARDFAREKLGEARDYASEKLDDAREEFEELSERARKEIRRRST